MTHDTAIIEATARVLSAFLSKSDAEWKDYVDEARIILDLCPAIGPLIRAAALEEYAVVLREAELQIEYLHDKFGRTGSGEAVLARIRALKDQP